MFTVRILRPAQRCRASVLLITLAFTMLILVIVVAFLVRSRGSVQTSQSYSREIVVQEIGEIAINKLAADLQTEIRVAKANNMDLVLPVRIGVSELNPRLSPLVRRTVGDKDVYESGYAQAGFSSPPHSNRASTVSTVIPAKNAWRFDAARWSKPALMAPNLGIPSPDWVYVHGQVPQTRPDEPRDVIGRYAAMVYDVGGLLDINEAGLPATLSLANKGSVAFADLNALLSSPSDADKLTAWRSGATPVLKDYYGDPAVTDPKQAGRLELPVPTLKHGNNRFFSRMELIEAANNGQVGLKTNVLPSFRTRSESANRVSAKDLYADGTSTPVRLTDNLLSAVHDVAFTVTRIDGTTETYTIKKGNPLIQNRFPLARLRWLADREPDGTPRHPNEIKQYFGLTWDTTNRLFIYTSPDSSTAASGIRTLKELAQQINNTGPVREPDFFEWLKAAIDPSSLGQTGGSTDREFGGLGDPGSTSVAWEMSKDLHILRIGANAIDQSDPDSIPTGIRSRFAGVTPDPFDSFGQENLPGLNEVIASVYRPNGNELEGYLQFELWNPNREAFTGRMPKGYDGQPITGMRAGVLSGRAVMEPFVYINTRHKFPRTPPLVGRETGNSYYGAYRQIADYSRTTLQATQFDSPDYAPSSSGLLNAFVALPFSNGYGAGTSFFDEPRLANAAKPFGEDSDNPAKSGVEGTASFGNGPPLFLGAPPVDRENAILLCTVATPDVSFSGVPLGGGIYPAGAQCTCHTPPVVATPLPSGGKKFNSARFFARTGTMRGIETRPVTLQIEVQTGGGLSFPVNRYHNLALDMIPDDGREQRPATITSGADLTQDAGTTQAEMNTKWASTNGTSYFSNWNQVGIRRGYPMIDPRTERFGLSDQMEATPGQGIYPQARVAVSTDGIRANMTIGLMAAVGASIISPGWHAQSPAATSPLRWSLYQAATHQSVPAHFVRNEWDGSTTRVSAYQDYDGVARPADARYVDTDFQFEKHPALPVADVPAALEARPTILDRPFRAVAELGCVFRDVPWKSLDLFSPESADRRILDVFSLEDRPTVAGKINPNAATVRTLQALLRGTALDPSGVAAAPVPDAQADAVAGMLAALNPNTAADRIVSLENLAQRINSASVSKPEPGDPALKSYKPKLENFLRALSSTTDTRNWQLMLDVVAQVGRVTPQSANLQDFIVEGQRRFFVHLTVDRITGDIVDQHLEPVYE
jgi:hypothetical protein